MTRRRAAFAALIALDVIAMALAFGWFYVLPRHAVLPGVAGCRSLAEPDTLTECVASRTVAAIEADGLAPALRTVQATAAAHPQISARCHEAMHQVTDRSRIPARRGFDIASAGTGHCADGLAHGVLVRTLADGNASELREISRYCTTGNIGDDLARRSDCVHGFGHGLHRRAGQSGALDLCDATRALATADRTDCYSGVFMEQTLRNPVKPTDIALRGQCSGVEGTDRRQACWYYVPSPASQAGLPPREIGRVCAGAPDSAAARSCASGLGSVLPAGTRSGCEAVPGSVYGACMEAWLTRTVAYTRDMSVNDAARVCSSSRSQDSAACARALGTALAHPRGADHTADECTALASGSQAACRSSYAAFDAGLQSGGHA